jgi:hypothetical protein
MTEAGWMPTFSRTWRVLVRFWLVLVASVSIKMADATNIEDATAI